VKLGFGIVGTGNIARAHALAIQGIEGAKLVACCDTVPARASRFAADHGATAYSDLESFLRHPGLDVVTVSTPSGSHLEPAVAGARAGKHLIVEKPLEITLERCDRIIDAVESAGVRCAGIFPMRFYPGPRNAKTVVSEGRLGRPVLGDAYVKWHRSQEYYDGSGWRGTWKLDGGGALMNQAIHCVDLLQWLMGPVVSVQALCGTLGHERIEVEDAAVAAISFASGAIGVMEASTAAWPGFPTRVELSGTAGSLVLVDKDLTTLALAEPRAGDEALLSPPPKPAGATSNYNDPTAIDVTGHLEQFRDLCRSVEERREPILNAREARKSVAIITAIYASARDGGKVAVS